MQGARQGNGGVEAIENPGGRLPYVLVKGKELLLIHSRLEVPARVGHRLFGEHPGETEEGAYQEAPGEDGVQFEHVVGAERAEEDDGRVDLVCVVADHVRLVVPLTKRIVSVEVDEHDLEDGAVDEAVNDTRQDVTTEHGARG